VAAAVKLHGFWLGSAGQVPPDQFARRLLPVAAVAVITMLSPTSTRQWAAAEHVMSGLLSVTVAVPLPVLAAVIVTV
jgi:hypothetical protein